jgi:CheY-like chemotaxis protein
MNENKISAAVLCVDDDEAVLDLCVSFLEKAGHAVFKAGNPKEAIAVFQEHRDKIDMLLTDIEMPDMNGRQLYENLSATRPDLKVLFMSGNLREVLVSDGRLKPSDAFLYKPFSPGVLLDSVAKVLASESNNY